MTCDVIFLGKNLEVMQIFPIFAAEKTRMLMIRQILRYTFILFMLLTVPAVGIIAMESAAMEIASEISETTINVQGSTVTVTGAQGEQLQVVSLTGKCIMTVRIDSPAQRIELNVPKGCYILKVGKVARKVTIR